MKTVSSTYSARITKPSALSKRYTLPSLGFCENPACSRYVFILSNHARGLCFSPYRARINLHTYSFRLQAPRAPQEFAYKYPPLCSHAGKHFEHPVGNGVYHVTHAPSSSMVGSYHLQNPHSFLDQHLDYLLLVMVPGLPIHHCSSIYTSFQLRQ